MDAALDRLRAHVPPSLWASEGPTTPALTTAWVGLADRAAARIAQWGRTSSALSGAAGCAVATHTILVLDAGAGLLGAALADAVPGAASVAIVDEKYFLGPGKGVDLGHLENYETVAKLSAYRAGVRSGKSAAVDRLLKRFGGGEDGEGDSGDCGGGGVVVVAESVKGQQALRAVQLFAALRRRRVALIVGNVGGAPDGLEQHVTKKVVYAPVDLYSFSAHEVSTTRAVSAVRGGGGGGEAGAGSRGGLAGATCGQSEEGGSEGKDESSSGGARGASEASEASGTIEACSVDGCNKEARSGGKAGLCGAHGGGLKCVVDGCNKEARSGGKAGLCSAHSGGLKCVVDGCNPSDARTCKAAWRTHVAAAAHAVATGKPRWRGAAAQDTGCEAVAIDLYREVPPRTGVLAMEAMASIVPAGRAGARARARGARGATQAQPTTQKAGKATARKATSPAVAVPTIPPVPSTPAVVLFVPDQLRLIRGSVMARLEASGTIRGGRLSSSLLKVEAVSEADEGEVPACSLPRSPSPQVPHRVEARIEELRDGTKVVVRRCEASRFVEGGYAACHYVSTAPEPDDCCFELELYVVAGSEKEEEKEGKEGGADCEKMDDKAEESVERAEKVNTDKDGTDIADEATPASPRRIAFIAFGAQEFGAGRGKFVLEAPERLFAVVNIDRLVVLPSHRKRGAKEVLLRLSEAFHAEGLPVRIKTGKPEVHAVLAACDLLAFDGYAAPRRGKEAKNAQAMVPYDAALALAGNVQAMTQSFHTITATAGKRRQKEGWSFWYVGAPVVHRMTGMSFMFGSAGWREVGGGCVEKADIPSGKT